MRKLNLGSMLVALTGNYYDTIGMYPDRCCNSWSWYVEGGGLFATE